MRTLTRENIIKFMSEVKPVGEGFLHLGWRVADFYDWLGGKSRIPSYYKMKSLPINQRDRLANYIYSRQYRQYRKKYIAWVKQTFPPFFNSLQSQGKVKAIGGRWRQIEFFEFEPLI